MIIGYSGDQIQGIASGQEKEGTEVVTDMSRLGEDEVKESMRLFVKTLIVAPTDGVDEVWINFKKAFRKVQGCLPFVTKRKKKEWGKNEVCEVSR